MDLIFALVRTAWAIEDGALIASLPGMPAESSVVSADLPALGAPALVAVLAPEQWFDMAEQAGMEVAR